MSSDERLLNICFVSSVRYQTPLDASVEKKFQLLSSLGNLFVIGFSSGVKPRHFQQHARFYLLPHLRFSVGRYLELFILAPVLGLWLIFRHHVNVLVAQSPYEGVMAALAKHVAGWCGRHVILIVESHGDFEETLFMHRRIYFPALYRALMRFAARFTFRSTDVLRAVSGSCRRQLEQWKPGLDVFKFFTWTNIEVFQQIGAERGETISHTFLYAGDVIPRKGVIHLVNAFADVVANFSQARLMIIGKEENQTYTTEVKQRVQELNLEQHIQFLPRLPQPELARYMGQAAVFVFPTYSEGLPRVVFEAMSAGLPVLSTAVSGIPEIVQEGETGILLEPGDEAGLSQNMCWLLEHPRETADMGRKAYAFACASFSSEAYVQGYRRMFAAARNILDHNCQTVPAEQTHKG